MCFNFKNMFDFTLLHLVVFNRLKYKIKKQISLYTGCKEEDDADPLGSPSRDGIFEDGFDEQARTGRHPKVRN